MIRTLLAILLCAFPAIAQLTALKGDGHSDDTVALENYIADICTHGGSVSLPPPITTYLVSRTIAIPCSGMYITGTGYSKGHQVQQFEFPPMVPIHMKNGVAEPVFDSPPWTTFENLDIQGYNEAVLVKGVINVSFRNVCMSVTAPTGMEDNTPLKITNSFWIWMKGGCLMSNGGVTTPILIMSGEQSEKGEAPLCGLITIEDVIGAGGGMKYIQRANQWGTAGNLVFRNITIEDTQTDILTMTTENGGVFGEFETITFDHVTTSDGGRVAVLNAADPSLVVKGLFINQSGGGGQKIKGRVLGFFDTAGSFDTLTGNSIKIGNTTIDSSGITFGTIKVGLTPNGALAEMVPLYQPPTNINAIVSKHEGGNLTGSHTYSVVAVDTYLAVKYSALAFAPQTVTLSEPGSAIITWTPSPSNPGGYYVLRDGLWSFMVWGANTNTFRDVGGHDCCWGRPNTPFLVPKLLVTQ